MDHQTIKDEPSQQAGICDGCHRFEWHCSCEAPEASSGDGVGPREVQDSRTPGDLRQASGGSALGQSQVIDLVEEDEESAGSEEEGSDQRGHARQVAGKQPRGYVSDEDDPIPDLASYFDQWAENMSMEDVIAMCRTHANALQRRVNFLKNRRLKGVIQRASGTHTSVAVQTGARSAGRKRMRNE